MSVALFAGAACSQASASGPDLARCADERVKTSVLSPADLTRAERACTLVLDAHGSPADRQKAAFYRSLMRFLKVMGSGAEVGTYVPLTDAQVAPSLADVEIAIGLDGPLKAEALALRVTINQVLGRAPEARADIDQAMQVAPRDPTPFVQRALEHERAGDVGAALADLDRALELDPRAATALMARANLLRRLGELTRARADYASLRPLGPPLRDLALILKSEVELRMGDVGAAYEDLLTAIKEADRGSTNEAKVNRASLLLRAGDVALDKLKLPDVAEGHFREAARLAPSDWNAMLGLARVEERRGRTAQAVAIYKRILSATKAQPNLVERLIAKIRLDALTHPLLRTRGVFRDAGTGDVRASAASPDGLKRVAIVIGEGDYTELASLPNARRDAAVMANALAEMGFDTVKLGENLGTGELRRVPALVSELAAGADVAVVFYAGHAVELSGANFLLPFDSKAEGGDLRTEALTLSSINDAASRARLGSLVIIDACRDDPFVEARAVSRSRGGTRNAGRSIDRLKIGLVSSRPAAPNNVVFHSTQPGQAALDGDGLDSPFVRALLSTLGTPGRSLQAVVQETTSRVSETTTGKQVPAAYGDPPPVALLPPALKR